VAEPATFVQLPPDMLTRRMLRRSLAGDRPLALLLEHLCTDTLYSVRDDFDDGLSDRRWRSQGFQWEENDHQGGISTLRDDDEADVDHWIASRTLGWRGDRRPTFMARLRTSLGKFEFGFTDTVDSGGLVTNKARPLANTRAEFAVACFDRVDSDDVELFADGRAISLSQSSPVAAVDADLLGQSFSIMVSLNEQSESRLWINGIYVTILRSGPSSTANLALWLQSRGACYVDYFQAWQDRVATS